MPPNTLRTAREAYDKSVTDLKGACFTLERLIPPLPVGEEVEYPPDKPRERIDSVAACVQCAEELEALEAGERAAHACTHRGDVAATDDDETRERRPLHRPARQTRQPKLRTLTENFDLLTESLKIFRAAVGNLCSLLNKEEDKEDYEDLMLKWIDYCEDIKDRARDVIEVLEAAQLGSTRVLPELQPGNPITTAASAAADIFEDPGAVGSGMNRNAII